MKVLIGIDSSSASKTVLETVAARPWPEGSIFRIINAVDPTPIARFPALVQDAMRSAEALTRAAAAQLVKAGHKADSEVLMGPARKEVSKYAKAWGADFVYVGSHGRGAISRFLLGSVAHAVLRAAPCSVGVVRPAPTTSDASSGLKILLAVDGSECSMAAAQSVAGRPWPARSELKIVSVAQVVVPGDELSASSMSPIYPANLLETLMEEGTARAKDAMATADKFFKGTGLSVLAPSKPPNGDPRLVILQLAEDWHANLIVLGSHGWTGLDRILMGSVSESVALHANCSVEVIRA
ncbi:MAG: universal stress protein [Candidatus Acidiferrales bacterium]